MKIGFLFDDTLDAPDGVQQYILTLGAWLEKQGHEVHYLVGQTARQDLANVHSLSRNAKVRFNKNRLSIPLPVSKTKLRQFLADQHYDVLHVQLPYSPQFAARAILAAPSQTAIVGTFHILPYGRLQTVGASLLGQLVRTSLARFDEIVAVSPAAQEFAGRAMNIPAQIVPNAVELDRFKKGKRTSSNPAQTIAFLGRLVPRKGALELLCAVRWMRDNGLLHNRRLLIGGSGQQEQKLIRYVTKYKLEEWVHFMGQLDESAKADFLANSDVAALPSIAGESFGITVVEAIAAGAGVTVGGDNPGYKYVLGATPETMVDPKNTVVFGQLLDKLLGDARYRETLGKKQRIHIQQFDVSVVGPQIEAIYKRAVQKHAIVLV